MVDLFFCTYTCGWQGVTLSADSIPGHFDGDSLGTISSNITCPEYPKKEIRATKSNESTVDAKKASKERFVLPRLVIDSLLEMPRDLLAFAWKSILLFQKT